MAPPGVNTVTGAEGVGLRFQYSEDETVGWWRDLSVSETETVFFRGSWGGVGFEGRMGGWAGRRTSENT